MSAPFLEERLPVTVRYGAQFTDLYNVDVVTTNSGQEYRRLVNPFPVRRFTVSYVMESPRLWDQVTNIYHRAYGKYAGFRVRCLDDFSTNELTTPPTASDQLLATVSPGVYQLQKQYGLGGTPIPIGLPTRTIFKPVAGTALIAIRNSLTGDHPTTAFTVDNTTGRVTLAGNKTQTITAITQAVNALVSTADNHGLVVGDSVHFADVSGMGGVNGRRGTVVNFTSNTFVVDIDTTGFSAYESGGVVNTRPQANEEVRGGCEFDIPCRFDSDLEITQAYPTWREAQSLDLVELLNP